MKEKILILAGVLLYMSVIFGIYITGVILHIILNIKNKIV